MYTPIFHIGKILLILNCFNSNLNRYVTESIIDTLIFFNIFKVNTKNNKLKYNNFKLKLLYICV